MSFLETPRFPDDPSYGSTFGCAWSASIVVLDNGTDEVNDRWGRARGTGVLAEAVKTRAAWSEIMAWARAVNGAADGFRMKDWSDYSSAEDGGETVTDTDQEIGVGDGTETQFQLTKTYAAGTFEHIRNIRKPVTGTTVIALDGTPTASGWTVDTTTGIVTFSAAPGLGVVVTAGYEYDVPVRLDLGDSPVTLSMESYELASFTGLPVIEILDPTPTSERLFHQGSAAVALAANGSFTMLTGGLLIVTPAGAGLTYQLPTTVGLGDGHGHFVIRNAGADSLDIIDQADDVVVAIAAGETYEFGIDDAGDWIAW